MSKKLTKKELAAMSFKEFRRNAKNLYVKGEDIIRVLEGEPNFPSFLQKKRREGWTLKKIGDYCGLSPSYIGKLLKKI